MVFENGVVGKKPAALHLTSITGYKVDALSVWHPTTTVTNYINFDVLL